MWKKWDVEDLVVDDGNQVSVNYSSPKCKLKFYQSQRDGEINCQIGSVDKNYAENGKFKWYYLNSLLETKKEQTIEELLSSIPDVPKSDEEQAYDIASKLKENYEKILVNLSHQ